MKYLLFVLTLALALNGCAIANKMSGVSQAKELSTNGEAAQAEILKIWDTGMTVNDDPVVGFLLDVHPEGKDAYQAETKLRISRVYVPQYQPGATVPVRIDPANPQRVSLDIYEFKK
ncbi:MAG TPA: DUF3592 domain-containing protein [Acidobacteriota bacterium]|jgi:hypothetical protein